MRNLTFRLVIASIAVLLFSFKPSDFNILLKTGVYQLPEGQIMQTLQGDGTNGYHYRIMQFYAIPTSAQKAALEEKGVLFFDYMPKQAFLTAIPVGIKEAELAAFNIRSIAVFENEMKLTKNVEARTYPEWALHGDQVSLIVAFYPNLTKESISRELSKLGYTYQFRPDYHFTRITLPVSRVDELIKHELIYYLQSDEDPGKPENNRARNDHRISAIQGNYAGATYYDGTGVLVAVGDDGDIGPHIDYQGRLTSYAGPSNGNHGDHVSGTVFGAGNLNPNGRGMAPGAEVAYWNYFASGNYYLDGVDTQYTNMGVRITQSSYSNGLNAGYTSLCRQMDEDIVQNPALMHVFSAGNSGTSNNGWTNVTGGHKQGKNVIATANVQWNDVIAGSSSRGPAHDGRIKPDISAVGTDVLSTVQPQGYANFTGTSMASPGISGVMATFYQAYRENNNNQDPDGGLMKAILMNTADDLGNSGPDFIHGYGRVNARRAIETIENEHFMIDSVSQGQGDTALINVPANTAELRVMLYWTDPPAFIGTSKALVNDLSMQVASGSTTWNPWVLNPTGLATYNQPAVRAIDSLNNAEQVTISNPSPGDFQVFINGNSVPSGPQKYYIVYSLVSEDIIVTHPIGGEHFNPTQNEVIRWDAPEGTSNFTVAYSVDSGATYTTITTTGANQRHLNWNVPSVVTGNAMIRVSRGMQNGTSEAPFSIIGVPTNLNILWACPDSVKLIWNNVTGATGYEVSMLGNKYMDSVGTSMTNEYVFTGINPNNTYYFSVRALGPDGCVGRRANAIEKAPGTLNCPLSTDAVLQRVTAPLLMPTCQGTNSIKVSIELANTGLQPIYSIPLAYQLGSGTIVRDTLYDTLTPGAAITPFTFSNTLSVSGTGNYSLRVFAELASDQNRYNDTLNHTFRVFSGSSQSLPYTESFDNFFSCSTNTNCEGTSCSLGNGWENAINLVEDDIDFRTNQGATASSGTGPSADHTGGGKYLYTEASGTCENREALLMTPCFDLATIVNPEASFWYHMNGTAMGDLHVDVLADGEWYYDVISPIIGSQGNNWIQVTMNLVAFSGKTVSIRFRAVTGNGSNSWSSDIAIDDFNIEDAVGAPVADFESSTNSVCVNTAVDFTDLSTNVPTSWSWSFTPNTVSYLGGTTSSSQNPQLSFSALGMYTVSLTATNPYGSDTIVKTAYIDVTNGSSLPIIEDFQGIFPPSGWTIDNPDGEDTWEKTSQITGPNGIATYAARVNNYNYTTNYAEDVLQTPIIDLSGVSSAYLIFDVAYARFSQTYSDGLRIEVSTDCGASYNNTPYLKQGLDLATVPDQGNQFFPSSAGQWRRDSVDLAPYLNNSVALRFVNISRNGNNLYLDNINIVVGGVAAPVASFTVSNATPCIGDTVIFTDVSTGTVNSYDWDFGTGATPQTATTAGPHQVVYSAIGNKNASLQVTNGGGINSSAQNLSVIEQPVSAFTAVNNNTLSVTFTDQSTNNPTGWNWDFGDGSNSTLQNPTHAYSNGGNYQVTLSASNACGTSDSTFMVYVSGIGLDENAFDAGIDLMPNPAVNQVTLSALFNSSRNITVELRDLTGKLLRQGIWTNAQRGNDYNIRVDEFADGVYFIRLFDDNHNITKRLVVRK